MDWFRSHHGAPTDPKWQVIARRVGIPAGNVAAVFWALMDYASQQTDRGSVTGFDIETISVAYGYSETEIQSVLHGMEEKGVTRNGRLASWDKRQPADGTNAERQARHRRRLRGEDSEPSQAVSRKVTAPPQVSPLRNIEQSRAEQNRTEKKEEAQAPAPDPALVLDDELRSYASEKAPSVDVGRELEKYQNWLAANGKRPRRPRRGFMNWLLKAQEYAIEKRPNGVVAMVDVGRKLTDEPWQQRIDGFRKSGFWNRIWGFKPGERGCRAPNDLLTEAEVASKEGRAA